MSAKRLTALLTAIVLGTSFAACTDRDNQDSGNEGQKVPQGGKTMTRTDTGPAIEPKGSTGP